ncbi:Retrotransposon-derived protein PEG10 [Rhizoctonia solani]|uniref:Retrotransposon-derived protein PEG10 n=1 Tax=Rhizoctonia solani TaxID=456999 RepID=A0A8H8P5C4_9AGAM|nr:Retrotransposon-derived protein PEG10 [Rhizoctonia solani]QRW24113.1 Retrotransposon-derived protein PEG10 [Rhizoctonia solani]
MSIRSLKRSFMKCWKATGVLLRVVLRIVRIRRYGRRQITQIINGLTCIKAGIPSYTPATLEGPSDAPTSCTRVELRPEILWQQEDATKLDHLHRYLIGNNASSRSQPPALHRLLEKNTGHLISHLDAWKQTMLQDQHRSTHTSQKSLHSHRQHPQGPFWLRQLRQQDFLVPIKDEPDPKGKRVKLESPEPPKATQTPPGQSHTPRNTLTTIQSSLTSGQHL